MGSNTDKASKLTNGAILIISTVLKHAKEGNLLCTTLEELGHPQPPTPLQTDKTTATGYSNGTIKQKLTQAMYMRFY
jgi:hypothetical protein